MIRVNLRPDIVAAAEGADPDADMVDSEIQRKGLVHIMVMLLIPVALYVYGAQAKPEKERSIRSITAQIAELRTFNDKQTAIVVEIQKIEKDEKDVERKIDAINSLTLGRLVEIKVLDLLQTIMREKMWIRNLEVDNSKFRIEGVAQSEMDVSIFLDDLTKNVLLRDVRLVESQQEMYEGQSFSKFKISANLEKSK